MAKYSATQPNRYTHFHPIISRPFSLIFSPIAFFSAISSSAPFRIAKIPASVVWCKVTWREDGQKGDFGRVAGRLKPSPLSLRQRTGLSMQKVFQFSEGRKGRLGPTFCCGQSPRSIGHAQRLLDRFALGQRAGECAHEGIPRCRGIHGLHGEGLHPEFFPLTSEI